MDVLAALVSFHSFWRYAVLLAAVLALVVSLGAWLGPTAQRTILQPVVRRAASLYIIVLDLQVLVGIVLWIGKGWYAMPGTFFRAEHPATMLLAMIAAHVGLVMAKRNRLPTGAARAVAIGVVVSFVLVLVGIPGVVRGG
ncbi:MAG TPA: hypothetical protein VFH48_28115 [Chloroflexota bacterium]|nr:hypothetical protein [Chloroflexota bacterium]